MKYKFCWIAVECKKGWKLGFVIGEKEPQFLREVFSCEKDIEKILKGNLVSIRREK